jgi:hypothetical protein
MKTTTNPNAISRNPRRLPVVANPDDLDAASARRWDCCHLNACVISTAARNWPGFTCAGCSAYQPQRMPREERIAMLCILLEILQGFGAADEVLASEPVVFPFAFANDPAVESFRMRLDRIDRENKDDRPARVPKPGRINTIRQHCEARRAAAGHPPAKPYDDERRVADLFDSTGSVGIPAEAF